MTLPIRGMHCASCEILIGDALEHVEGVSAAAVHHRRGIAEISYTGKAPSREDLARAVESAGYEVGSAKKLSWITSNKEHYTRFLYAAAIVFVLYRLVQLTGITSLSTAADAPAGLLAVLMIGLIAGFSTCMALVGGLVLGISARHAELHPEAARRQKFRPHLFFNAGRILGYAALGGLIGLVGSAFELSSSVLGGITVAVGAIMVLLGLKLVELFPRLSAVNITLPSSIGRMLGIKKEQKEYSHRGAMTAGALTFFLPCGFTQSMQLFAMTTGSFWQGAAIMGVFALGTAPGLLGIGGLSSFFKGTKAKLFFVVAGIIVILLGWYNVTVGLRLTRIAGEDSTAVPSAPQTSSIQTRVLTATFTDQDGVFPAEFAVQKGESVRLDIAAKDSASGCAAYMVIPGLSSKQQAVRKGTTLSFAFTPKKTGTYPITCGMGMITWGFITVR